MYLHSQTKGAVLLLGIIAAAGYALWDQGPGEMRRLAQRNSQAVSEMKMLDVAAIQYAYDHHDKYPDAPNWEQELRPYLGEWLPDFSLPVVHNQKRHRIAINSNIASRNISDLKTPGSCVLFFESDAPGPNAADNLRSLPDTEQGVVIVYADGWATVQPPLWKQWFQQDARLHREALGELEDHFTAKK